MLEPAEAQVKKHQPTDSGDLSIEISAAVEKLPGDKVRCRRVGVNTYRCNWMELERNASGNTARFIESYRVRDSRFLRATKPQGRLVIEDLTISACNN